MPNKEITYRDDARPGIDTIASLYKRSCLERPVHDLPRLQRMYDQSPLVLTAWEAEDLVGILRGWSDGGFVGYIADLAVDPLHQHRGIGKRLLDLAIETNTQVQFVLRAADTAVDYYRRISWTKVDNGWYWPRRS